jgi:putative DNA-invertase from lambdoid prophage Rac
MASEGGRAKSAPDGAQSESVGAESAGAYVRVSSPSQSHDMQRGAIETAARARGHIVGRWYAEKVSGGRGRPPELLRVLDDARLGKIRLLYVYRLDRLSRRGVRDMLGIVEDLRACGCKLVTLADGYELDGPAGEIVLAVLAGVAKMEREAIGERIRAARVRLEGEGRAWGRPARMSGELVTRASAMKAKGHTVRYIAAALKVPRATVARALARLSRKPVVNTLTPGPRKAGMR